MVGESGSVIVHNGEVYNYVELRDALARHWTFKSTSDTEAVLAAYDHFGDDCLSHFRGMFATAIWDGSRLFCARDRFGIKPFYYAIIDGRFIFASEAKALLPFLDDIETDEEALAEHLTFQYTIGDKTLFKGIQQLPPAHFLIVANGGVTIGRYWDVQYDVDWSHTAKGCSQRMRELLDESMALHLRSDVPVGSYLSGGMDSSVITMLMASEESPNSPAFHGKFTSPSGFDESEYARDMAESVGAVLNELVITADDFRDNISDVIYALDFPVAGPGSFPQYMVSRMAAQKVKVVLGGQGGDEIFGGYARYLIAYFEQCINAAIDGTYKDGNFVVTAESIIPNLTVLQEYKPLIKSFWSRGLFGPLDERYFHLIDRSNSVEDEINWGALDRERVFESFKKIFNSTSNLGKEAYFDSMTHFDFKCLLPALLHVEDRMSMAHGLESRLPFLDHPLVEFLATVPADIKFKDGKSKQLLRSTFQDSLPPSILNRRDKMGFPVPLNDWATGSLRDFITDTFSSVSSRNRDFLNTEAIIAGLDDLSGFSRKLWGLLSLELWHQKFHDKAPEWRGDFS